MEGYEDRSLRQGGDFGFTFLLLPAVISSGGKGYPFAGDLAQSRNLLSPPQRNSRSLDCVLSSASRRTELRSERQRERERERASLYYARPNGCCYPAELVRGDLCVIFAGTPPYCLPFQLTVQLRCKRVEQTNKYPKMGKPPIASKLAVCEKCAR
jgi:hypothetical protein